MINNDKISEILFGYAAFTIFTGECACNLHV